MKKLTKAMAISLLASTVAISTVGCRYTVEVKDNEAPTKQEQQVQPTANDKSENDSTKTEKENTTKENTNKEAEKTEKSSISEKTNKKDEKSSSHTTAKGESKNTSSNKSLKHEQSKPKYIECGICGKLVRKDRAVYSEAGYVHEECKWKVEHTEQKGTDIICGICKKYLGHADTDEEGDRIFKQHYYNVHDKDEAYNPDGKHQFGHHDIIEDVPDDGSTYAE